MRASLVSIAVAVIAAPLSVRADSVSLSAAADNTLFENAEGALSNGAGQFLFAGATAIPALRRACVRFDVSSIPPGSVINSATLTLYLTRSISGEAQVTVHRITAAWGEAGSAAAGNEGGGAFAMPGDATWVHTFFDTSLWVNEGGDFSPVVSAAQTVAIVPAPIVWADAGLAADVQAWIDGTALNAGWILIGDETAVPTAKQFGSRENVDPSRRPRLDIDFTPPPPPCTGDYDGDLDIDFSDITFVLANFNSPYTFADITVVLANFGNPC